MTRDEVADAVLEAARSAFHNYGYAHTTMKGVASAAGVAPGVLRKYYASKEQMFAAAVRFPFDPSSAVPQLLAPGLEGMGERLVRGTFEMVSDEQSRQELIDLFQSGIAAGKASADLREFLEESVIDRVAGVVGIPDARMRAALISSHLIGLATVRFIIRLEPLASAPEDDVVRMFAPIIQDLLDPTKSIPGT
ncbi:MAG: TetR family transcriptional regulator [Candidatus Nanopelagicales bacterium]|nr:TetR family transcriptional regulator [Candidatus Nanopelagicales bacterium]MDZ4249339.1 TetR family transcriptional regulator [Candidatus Nanopelagicales bacterium]